ncbi:MAG: Fpg/Nei family DNA glycosylase [Terriglobia bacterium]
MPEIPDITIYIEALQARIAGARLERARVTGPFLLRTVTPPIQSVEGRTVRKLRRVGKRIAIGLERDLWLVLHLMIAGRLHWREKPTLQKTRHGYQSGKNLLATFEFSPGILTFTEAGSQRRASLHVVEGEEGLRALDPGGLEVLEADFQSFSAALARENHTLKRALTDPRLLSGIGNAYSDEILHCAQLSPVALTQRLNGEELARLYTATRETLTEWTERLRAEAAGEFPEKVTAFRGGMAVHGRYGQPCPRCGTKVQRIRYASNETNYCPRCQTGGKLLADRALSRLLKEDWPRSLEEMEQLIERHRI